jgi:peptidoglycan/xylan/chitin deacetylase (PgdA/CDA1 family)
MGPLTKLGGNLYRDNVPVFMLHRMACRDLGVNGHAPELIRESLSFLRKKKFNFVTIDDVANAITSGKSLPQNSVAFTLDDGYFDQIDIATDIFAEFDCPATYYVSTGFIAGDLWYWNDKIEYLVEHCPRERIATLISLYPHLNLNGKTRQQITDVITEDATLKTLSEMERKASEVATEIGIDLPLSAPEKYKPATWSKLKEIEKRGMVIGAHTYSHCILSRETDERSKFEIERSCSDLSVHLESPSQVFCYPVGRTQDFGVREVNYVKELGCTSATSSLPGAVDVKDRASLFAIPRFSFPDTREDFFQYATWIESFKTQLRQLNKN